MILLLLLVDTYMLRSLYLGKDTAEIQFLKLPVLYIISYFQAVYLAYHFIHGTEAQFGHNLTEFFCQKVKQVDHMLRLAGKEGSQFRILRSHAHRAGVHMTLTHHDTAFGNQSSRRNAKLLGSQQDGHRNVATRFDLSVGLYCDTTTQIVHDERLMCLRQA